MRNSDGVIFLTSYARETIQRIIGPFEHGTVIPHGVGESFRRPAAKKGPPPDEREVHCLYVSNTAMYKHQWVVVRAIGELRKRGRKISLTLAGGGTGNAQRILEEEIARTDPEGRFVTLMGAVAHQELPSLLERADLFVFASSCENMPNTLLEAMASGLPIACSNRGPMPEVLQDGGTYFDPEDPASIAEAVEKLLKDTGTMEALAGRAKALSDQYSWERCSRETWAFLAATVARLRKSGAV